VTHKDKIINVLFLETSMRVGGTETVITRLFERFDRKKIRPVLCCLYEPGILGEQLIRQGVTVYHHLADSRWNLGLPLRLWRLFRKEKVDVLFIVNQPITQFWGTLCAVLAGIPVRIAAIRSTGKINRIHRRLLINRLTFPWMTRVTALSQMHKDYLAKEEKIDTRKMEIISNGVDLKRFDSNIQSKLSRKDLGVPDGVPLAGIVAMLRPEKGHTVFIEAAQHVVKQVPTAHFLIVGDGPEKPRLKDLAVRLGIEPHIHFLGSRNDVPEILNLLDVAVLSSHAVVETVSNAVLEYMAVRKPVVSTRVGSLPEMLDEGRTGYLVEPGDFQAMAERLIELLQNPAKARQMGQAGREKIERYYTVEKMVQNWENLFERLLNEKKKN